MDIKEMDSLDAYERGRKDTKKSYKVAIIAVGVASALIGGSLGYLITQATDPVPQKIREIYNYLSKDWLYKGSVEDLEKELAYLMISGLEDNDYDHYLIYTDDYASQGLNITGSGVYGVSLSNYYTEVNGVTYGGLRISDLYEGTLKEAGAMIGDVIYACKQEGEEYKYIEDYNVLDSSSLIRPKEEGKSVTFLISRDGENKEITASLGRYTQVPVTCNSYKKDGKHIVELRVSTFLGDVPAFAAAYLNKAIEDNGNIDTLLIDLRDNGGGYTSYGRDFAKLFLDYGQTIYTEKNGDGKVFASYVQDGSPAFKIDDIRILQNGSTASASELFVLAMKDNAKAKVYGTTSYGKGIEQTLVTLSDKSVLRFTTAQIYGPKGYSIHEVGITPDYETNEYKKYISNLVSYCEDDGNYGYRLSYRDENAIKEGFKHLGIENDMFRDSINEYKARFALPQDDRFDSKTFYRYEGDILKMYFEGYKNEISKVLL